jgi:L-lactate dehydrogenase complex protein LldG
MIAQSREEILERIRKALADRPTIPNLPSLSEVYNRPEPDELLEFLSEFSERLGCDFYYCHSEFEAKSLLTDLIQERGYKHVYAWEPPLQELLLLEPPIDIRTTDAELDQIDCGITLCEALIARTGSILVSSRQMSGRRLTIYPPHHIIFALSNQIMSDIKDALRFIEKSSNGQLPSMLSFITGNSRTADIEKTLVNGAHGPKELTLFLIDENLEND